MRSQLTLFSAVAALAVSGALQAQQAPTALVTRERAQAELDAPKLAEVLELKPGMTVADVGAGGGAMTVVFGKWIGSGQVFATDISATTLATLRDYVTSAGLTNVTVIEGAAGSTNLPAACCDAIFLRHVYHHITDPEAFDKSLHASLKPGGRLAILDFLAVKGTPLPDGVPANREGHGVSPAIVISEMTNAGLSHVKTIDKWPPDDTSPATYFLVLFKKPPQG